MLTEEIFLSELLIQRCELKIHFSGTYSYKKLFSVLRFAHPRIDESQI
jgi:hypothetical protein